MCECIGDVNIVGRSVGAHFGLKSAFRTRPVFRKVGLSQFTHLGWVTALRQFSILLCAKLPQLLQRALEEVNVSRKALAVKG